MDLTNVKPLDIDPWIGKVKNRVALVGVELEGGWLELPPGILELVHDGSVFEGRPPAGVRHIGELPLGPMVPAAIAESLKIHWPAKMNKTCGMHVHMSFDTLWYYSLLMVPEYQETVCAYLTRWAKDAGLPDNHNIFERLRGESRFCQKKFWPDEQAATQRKNHDQNQHGHRYTIIHYCGRNKTIECRVLPMIPKLALSVKAIHHLLDITNACIYVLGAKQKREKFGGKITLPNGMTYEETTIEQI